MTEIRPVIYVPLERSISYASLVLPWITGLAGQGIPFIHLPYGPTDVSRNEAAKRFLKTDATHLVMLDLDHIHPLDIVHRLARTAVSSSSLVVGGLNYNRRPPHQPCCGVIDGDDFLSPVEWGDSPFEVDMIGTGSIIIHRGVFETIPLPWFYYPMDAEAAARGVWYSDDVGFSRNCKEYGIKMMVDPTITSPHIIDNLVTEQSYRAFAQELEYDDNERVLHPATA